LPFYGLDAAKLLSEFTNIIGIVFLKIESFLLPLLFYNLTLVYILLTSMDLTPSWKRGRPNDLDQYFDADAQTYESPLTKATLAITDGWRLIKKVVRDKIKKPVSLLETILKNKK